MSVAAVLGAMGVLGKSVANVPAVYADYIKLQQQVMELLHEHQRQADELKAVKEKLVVRDSLRFEKNRYFRKTVNAPRALLATESPAPSSIEFRIEWA